MKTLGDPAVLHAMVARLARVAPDSRRRWGTLTANEMLCHLADATDMVLRRRPRDRPVPDRSRVLLKLLGLWAPVRWPHGWQTNPRQDPKRDGTRPASFDPDRARAIESLRTLGEWRTGPLEAAHGVFGRMSVRDWQRWAYKHTDHHLRQFGS